ncbi:tetratricopeptide repeat protein [Leptolyngbyaceae cyanobacterium UHCC 1019]
MTTAIAVRVGRAFHLDAMGRWNQGIFVFAIFISLLGSGTFSQPALAESTPTAASQIAPAVPTTNPSFWEKLQRLQEDKQLQELVERDMERSITIRAQIQDEVDRAFNHTTALLNVLLAVLTCLPVLAAIGIWFIRRSVLNQIVSETRKQLKEEVEKQLEAEVTAELKQQTEDFQKKIEALEAEFHDQLSQLKSLFLDTQKEKDQIIQELSQTTPSPFRENATPETQQKIQALTQQLERLQLTNAQLSFTADDYVEQGKAFYFENRFEEAIACYDKALTMEPENFKAWFSYGAAQVKLQQLDKAIAAYDRALQLKPDFPEAWFGRGTLLTKQQRWEEAIAAYDQAILVKPDFFLAWFGKARCYALQGQPEAMLDSLKRAIQLNPERSKEAAKTDSAFDSLRDDPRFQVLVMSNNT